MATLGHPGMSARRLRDRRRREDDLLRGAAAIATLSRWSAGYLVDDLGLDPARVHVVPPAANALAADRGPGPADPSRQPRPHRLLFVGRDFGRKGGRLLLDAFAVVRARRPEVTLTVIGPDRWPLDGTPPPGVEFLGRQPASRTATAFATHDLFVMPTVFEPYGIVYVEAIAAGLPCVAPAAWAIEEIVDDGRTGRLVAGRDAEHWAGEIAAALDDEALYASTAAEAPHVRAHFRWDRVAHQMVEICTRAVGGAPSPTRRADPGHHTPGANHV
jgi:glycosyltransferase involved in cell wall biosynthesis